MNRILTKTQIDGKDEKQINPLVREKRDYLCDGKNEFYSKCINENIMSCFVIHYKRETNVLKTSGLIH